jgi:hypothetical protein
MIDYFNIPGNNLGTQVFYFVPSSTSVNEFDFWQKPKNCKFVYIIAIGGGGGGAGGQTGTGNRYGGGGGGSLQYQEDFILQIYYPIFYTFKSVKEVVEVHLAVVEVLDNYLMFAQDQTH